MNQNQKQKQKMKFELEQKAGWLSDLHNRMQNGYFKTTLDEELEQKYNDRCDFLLRELSK